VPFSFGRKEFEDVVMKSHWQMFAGYNAWANERVFAAAAGLSDADYRADKGAFFKSVHGTLNHILVGDLVWMQRFTGEGPLPSSLDAILHESLPALHQARRVQDARIIAYIESLDNQALAGEIRYRPITTTGEIVQPLAPALAHWFNHQTHHRGQVHALLTSLKSEAPSLDLVNFQREQGIGARRMG
jgi:uncharacterized damage-inducible protein DinB